MPSFGDRLDRVLQKVEPRPSGTELARIAGVHKNTFNRWRRLKGEPKIPQRVYWKFAEVLGCQIVDLLPDDVDRDIVRKVVEKMVARDNPPLDPKKLRVSIYRLQKALLDSMSEARTIGEIVSDIEGEV